MLNKPTQERWPALVFAICALACLAALVPIWSVAVPPLQDYPPHLVRMHILTNLENLPAIQTFYEVRWELLPNLAMDVVVPPIAEIMPLDAAGKVFISIVVLMWIVGPLFLHYALFGRLSLWPLLASFFAYNWCLFTGLVNFIFGAGVFFFVMGAWVYATNWPTIWRLLLFSLLATALYFCHLVAFGIYGLAVVGFELGRTVQMREFLPSWRMVWRWGTAGAQFIVPVALYLFFSPERSEEASLFHLGSLRDRLNGLRAPVLFELGIIDHLVLLFVAGLFVYGIVTRSLKFHPAFAGALFLLILVAVLLPFPPTTLFHMRLPSVIAPLLFAGTAWVGTTGRKSGIALFALAAALFLSRTAVAIDRWQLQDARIAEFRAATAKIEEGSSMLFVLSSDKRPGILRMHTDSVYPLIHLGDYATIDRSAFVPSVFADTDKQVLRPKGNYATIHEGLRTFMLNWDDLLESMEDPGSAGPIHGNWRTDYDYVSVLNLEKRDFIPPDFLTVIHEGSFFTIFEIEDTEVIQ